LDEVPEELLPKAVRLVASAVNGDGSDASMEGLVKLLEEMDRRDLWRHLPENEVEYFISGQLSYQTDRADPGVQVEQLGAIQRDDLREIALREVGRRWGMYTEPGNVLRSVETLPPGLDRDRFISGLLECTYEEKVFSALREKIEDASVKEKAPKEPWSGEGG
jgi:hypothetical protein